VRGVTLGDSLWGVMLIKVTCVGPGSCARADWCGEGEYIGSSVAYLVVEGSGGREYWT
jgi:hypothetical protein